MLLKRGDSGKSVEEIQRLLGIKVDGDFGRKTYKAVKEFQKKYGLMPDGVVGNNTYAKLMTLNSDPNEEFIVDVDGVLSDKGKYTTDDGLEIHRMYLDTDEYVTDQGETEKFYLFLHHTAGNSNPYNVAKDWNNDTRGRIGTQFIVGGIANNGDTSNDGVVLECFPDKYFAWHLGKTGSHFMHKHSVGIEITSWGWLEKRSDGKFYNYVNGVVPESQVETLDIRFNGYKYYHRYTDKQIENTRLLIKDIMRRYPSIDIQQGLLELLKDNDPVEAFKFNSKAYSGKKGMWSHTSVRYDKTDCYPDERLVKMLKTFYE